jgi:very-short-patch-repair endonuclease
LVAFPTEMGRETDQPRSGCLDPRVSELAERQYGVVTFGQLLDLGLGEHGIYERVRTKRLHRLHRGVYAVGHEQLRRDGRLLAAVLACGRGAVLSHASAAALWEIRGSAATVIDVTVPSRAGRLRRSGIRIHRSGRLRAEDVTTNNGIPVTTVARTLLDLADVLPKQALKRAIDESEYLRLFDLISVVAVVNANPGRRGATLLKSAAEPPQLTRSELENRFLRLCARHQIPKPLTNHTVCGYQVDAFWPRARLVLELDGYAAHGTRRAFQSDRERDRRLVRAGFRAIRVTPVDVTTERVLAQELRELIRS